MRHARRRLGAAVLAGLLASMLGCSDDRPSEGQVAGVEYVATGHYIEEGGTAQFCRGVDESSAANCAGQRLFVPVTTTEELIEAGVLLEEAEGFREVQRRTVEPVTLRFGDVGFDEEARAWTAGSVTVDDDDVEGERATLHGEGDLRPSNPCAVSSVTTECGMTVEDQARLDQLAREISPSGTVLILLEGNEVDGFDGFGVYSMVPLTDGARELLTSTLSGDIHLDSWAAIAD